MSMYIGPYAEATASAVEREIAVYGCTNRQCARWKDREGWPLAAAFCATCGSPTGQTTKKSKKHPSPYEALGESERLSPISDDGADGVCYFIPNIRGDGCGERLGGDRGEDHHLDLSDVDRETEMKKFAEQFSEELDALRKVYDVEICWGLQVHWS